MNTQAAFSVIIYIFIGSGVISLYRVLAGPTTADRLIGLNIISAQILAVLVLFAAMENLHVYLDVALVYDIFGFVGILAIARYTGKKEALK